MHKRRYTNGQGPVAHNGGATNGTQPPSSSTHRYTSPSPRPQLVPGSPAMSPNTSPSSPLSRKKDVRKYTGCSFLDDYERLGKLGEGTFGEVHKARHKTTGELVALKRILIHNENEGIPITAVREIKILKSLSNPNIVPLSDIAIERGDAALRKRANIYMVIPYMDHDLTGLLENPSVSFSLPQIKCYLKQLLKGVCYLHGQKVLHRDMKASNLLIDNRGNLRITDFGLARAYDPSANDRYTNCVVTRWYRPPELLLGEAHYTGAIDLWGVGCVFGEMLRGKPILQGSSDLDQLDRIFKLCGSPTEYSMPGWSKLPGCEGVRSFKSYPRRVREEFASYGEHAADFLDRLLVLNPNRRLTAAQALDHEFLWSEPYPANPTDLPTYESSHEYDRRKRKQAKHHHHPPGPQGGGPDGTRDAAATHHTATRPRVAPHRPNRPNGYHRQGHQGGGGMRMDAYRGGPVHNNGNSYASSGSGAPYGSRPPRGHGPPHNPGYRRY